MLPVSLGEQGFGFDRIELGHCPPIGEQVRQHAFRHRTRPLQQDLAGLFQSPGRKAEAAQRDKGVTAPISEPRVPRHNGPSLASLDEIRVCGSVQAGGKPITTLLFVGS